MMKWRRIAGGLIALILLSGCEGGSEPMGGQGSAREGHMADEFDLPTSGIPADTSMLTYVHTDRLDAEALAQARQVLEEAGDKHEMEAPVREHWERMLSSSFDAAAALGHTSQEVSVRALVRLRRGHEGLEDTVLGTLGFTGPIALLSGQNLLIGTDSPVELALLQDAGEQLGRSIDPVRLEQEGWYRAWDDYRPLEAAFSPTGRVDPYPEPEQWPPGDTEATEWFTRRLQVLSGDAAMYTVIRLEQMPQEDAQDELVQILPPDFSSQAFEIVKGAEWIGFSLRLHEVPEWRVVVHFDDESTANDAVNNWKEIEQANPRADEDIVRLFFDVMEVDGARVIWTLDDERLGRWFTAIQSR